MSTTPLNIDQEALAFAQDPASYFGHSYARMHGGDAEHVGALQKAALRQRFAELRDQVAVLKAMADEQGIDEIDEIEDAVPLLFPHTVYKSYPAALLSRGRFGDLTKWLGRLTKHDLSRVPMDDIDTIDGWLDTLDEHTDLHVSHSSGTTGVMTFLPRSAVEWDRFMTTVRAGIVASAGFEAPTDDGPFFDVVWPTFRWGRSGILRAADLHMRYIAGSEDRFHAMNPGRMSADVMFLAGRLRAAAARGEQPNLEIPQRLLDRKAELEETDRNMREQMPRFFGEILEQLRGQRVYLLGPWNVLYELAKAGLGQGHRGVFAPDSMIVTGGGAKGQVVPDGWEEVVQEFAGVPRLHHIYAMTEVMGTHRLCEHQRYHVDPWVIPYVLDPETGAALPREGVQTGRAAFYDLVATSYWGGFVTGDEVTIDWSPCRCGLTTPHLAKKIERYSEKQGGDDKITCAAADEAHENAISYLTGDL